MADVFTVNFAELRKCLEVVLKGQNSVLICGESGIGKSETIFNYVAQNLGQWRNLKNKDVDPKSKKSEEWYHYPVIDIRVAQMADVGDITGIPFEHDGKTTKFKPMHWMDRICHEPCILLADEIDRGDRTIGQSFFQIGDSRRFGDNELHPHTVVISTINGGALTQNKYQVRQFDFAELSRWVIFYLQPTPEEWLSHAVNRGVHSLICSFVAANPSFLRHTGKFEPDKIYPTPRSWVRLSEVLKGTEILNNLGKTPDQQQLEPYIQALLQSYVGFEATTSFFGFCNNIYKDLPSIEDILERFDSIMPKLKTLMEMQQNVVMDKVFLYFDSLPDTHIFSDQHKENIMSLFPLLNNEVYMHNFKKLGRDYVWAAKQLIKTASWLKRFPGYSDAERFGNMLLAGQKLDETLGAKENNG